MLITCKKFTTHFLWILKSKTVEIKGIIELQHFMVLNRANWNQRGIEIHEKGIHSTPSFLLMSHTLPYRGYLAIYVGQWGNLQACNPTIMLHVFQKETTTTTSVISTCQSQIMYRPFTETIRQTKVMQGVRRTNSF